MMTYGYNKMRIKSPKDKCNKCGAKYIQFPTTRPWLFLVLCKCSKPNFQKDYNNLPNSDFSLVDFSNSKPSCKKHGAMNKMTADGIWRCVSTYEEWWEGGNRKFNENACKAGCQETA